MADTITSADGTLKVKYNNKYIICYPKTKHDQIIDFTEGVESICRPITGRDTLLSSENKLYKKGEIIVEYDKRSKIKGMKIGDGTNKYTSLPYVQSQTTQFDIETKDSSGKYYKIEQDM